MPKISRASGATGTTFDAEFTSTYLRQDGLFASLASIGGGWRPEDNGLLAASCDPVSAAGTTVLVAGTVYLQKVPIRNAVTVGRVHFQTAGTQGSGTSDGSFVGLYSSAGTLLTSSADVVTPITAAIGAQSVAVTTPQNLTAGSFVWVGMVVNLTVTQPSLSTVAGAVGSRLNIGLQAKDFRTAANGTSAVELPATVTVTSNTSTGAVPFWVGLS